MTSTYADAFLGAIHDDPDDDTPRLVYADWLEEQGDSERAEFIRVQCALERLAEDDPRRAGLEGRERELRRRYGERWAGVLARRVRSFGFRRGLIEVVQLDGGQLLRHADTLFRLAPVRHLRLQADARQAEPLATCPYLDRITTLDLTFVPYPERDLPGRDLEALRGLLDSPHLTRLTSLRLRGVRAYVLPALAGSRHLGRLTRLDLGWNGLGVGGLPPLLGLRLPALEDLGLEGNGLDNVAVRLLAGWPSLAGLTGLDLSTNAIGPDGCAALARCPHLGRLTTLRLGFNPVGDSGASALARWRHGALERLYLGRNQLGADGVRALANSPRLARLTHLDLDYNDVPAGALEELAASRRLRRLKALYLRCGKGLTPRLKARLQRRFGEGVCRVRGPARRCRLDPRRCRGL
jgi:uncharacterized protein (TIGR02996 family)